MRVAIGVEKVSHSLSYSARINYNTLRYILTHGHSQNKYKESNIESYHPPLFQITKSPLLAKHLMMPAAALKR